VNATGVWSDRVASLAGDPRPIALRPAKGVHITIPLDLVPIDVAVVLPVPGDRRSVFVVPWDGHVYVGTTDTDYDGPLDDVVCTAEEVDYLLRALNASIASPVRPTDVVGSWAGLRPLVAGTGSTVDLSRRHTVAVAEGAVINVTGGKLTTWRRMAADAVDAALPVLNKERRCRTKRLRLRGSEGWERVGGAGVDADLAQHLAGRYGGEARVVLALMSERPELAEPLVPGLAYRRAEAVFAARCEQAGSVDDVLSRRTRARLLDRDASAASARIVADLVGDELGWGAERRQREVNAYRDSVERERRALEPAAAAASA
jgi:glycerol-3-phosphate dehydrogenase